MNIVDTTDPGAMPNMLESRTKKIEEVLAKRGGLGAPATAEDKPAETATGDDETEETDPEEETEGAKAETKPAEAKPKEKPKTARAREWADLKVAREETARAVREAKRQTEAATKERAELQKMQAGLRDLEKLRKENPKEFLKHIGDGDFKKLFKAALEEPELTNEQKELAELRAELQALKGDVTQTREEREAANKRQEAAQAAQADRDFHSRNLTTVRRSIDELDGLETLKAQPGPVRDVLARHAYAQILDKFDKTGVEVPLSVALASLEKELFSEQPPPSGASERATGADPTAKPEAKRAPVLSSQAATKRAAGMDQRPSLESRLRQASKRLVVRK